MGCGKWQRSLPALCTAFRALTSAFDIDRGERRGVGGCRSEREGGGEVMSSGSQAGGGRGALVLWVLWVGRAVV